MNFCHETLNLNKFCIHGYFVFIVVVVFQYHSKFEKHVGILNKDLFSEQNAMSVHPTSIKCHPKCLFSTINCLKAKKTHGFNSCFVISVYPLDILSIKKATKYRNN